MWWASRQLRELEEQCCDGRVLELVPDQPRTYAAALVDTLEFLSEQPRHRPIAHGDRFRRLIVQEDPHVDPEANESAESPERHARRRPRHPSAGRRLRRRSGTGRASAPPKGQPSAGAQAAILRGRVTDEAGSPLADVRVRVAIPATDMRFVETGTDRGFVRDLRPQAAQAAGGQVRRRGRLPAGDSRDHGAHARSRSMR